MPVILTAVIVAVAVAGWLVLCAWLTGSRSSRVPAGGEPGPSPAGTEPPAVVSLLAGNLATFGYPATLLDLAARGWFRLEARAGGPVMCVLGEDRSASQLASYERLAYTQLVTRAGERRDVPAGALADGFSGQAAAIDRGMKSAKDSFMEAFTSDVIEDARRRGLSRPRMWAGTGLAVRGEKLTPAGRAALRGWRASCAGPASTGPASTGPASTGPASTVPASATLLADRGAAVVVPPDWPNREVAYAAALGRARAAVKLFSGPSGQPRGKVMWSGYGGSWRQITIGDPFPATWLQACGSVLLILACVAFALLPATLATVVLAHGQLRAAACGVLACDAVVAVLLLGKDASTPGLAEFDGQVIEAWIEEESGENTTSIRPCLAIDDGVRDRAWAFSVTPEQYARFTPGTLVHARVNPRRNRVLDMRPLDDRFGRQSPLGYTSAD